MATTAIAETKSMGEIIKTECQERRFKEINIGIFNDGIQYIANKVIMFSRLHKDEYYLVLSTNRGCLVNKNLDLAHAESEFTFICSQAEAVQSGMPVTINFFDYILYDKNMEEKINRSFKPILL